MYRQSELGLLLTELQYWVDECYHMGYPAQFADKTGWLVNVGKRTETLAIKVIEEREKVVREIISISRFLNLDIMAIMNDVKYLDLLMDTSRVTPDELNKMSYRIKEGLGEEGEKHE